MADKIKFGNIHAQGGVVQIGGEGNFVNTGGAVVIGGGDNVVVSGKTAIVNGRVIVLPPNDGVSVIDGVVKVLVDGKWVKV